MKNVTVCVYGAASDAIDSYYKEQVTKLGSELATRGYSLVYGGGGAGLMGAAARGMTEKDGNIIGVVPKFMGTFETLYDKCTKVIHTETMAERKQIMEDTADAFIIVPGGIGTYDEFFQILTLRHLQRNDKPIIVLNLKGFFDDVLAAIGNGIIRGFIAPTVASLFDVCETVDSALTALDKELAEAE